MVGDTGLLEREPVGEDVGWPPVAVEFEGVEDVGLTACGGAADELAVEAGVILVVGVATGR